MVSDVLRVPNCRCSQVKNVAQTHSFQESLYRWTQSRSILSVGFYCNFDTDTRAYTSTSGVASVVVKSRWWLSCR